MSLSDWRQFAASVGEESAAEASEDAGIGSVSSSWGNVAAQINTNVIDTPCGESLLSGWAAVAANADESGVDDGEQSFAAELHIDLSQHADPVGKKRGRPSKCFANLPSPHLGEAHALVFSEKFSASHLSADSCMGVAASASSVARKVQVANLTVSVVESYVRQPVHGYRPLSVCTAAMVAASSCGPSKRLDDAYYKIQSNYIESGSDFHVTSKIAKAKELEVDQAELKKKLCIMAAGQYVYSKYQRWALEKAVTEKVVADRLLCYIECMVYDETPMKLKVADPIMRFPSASGLDDISLGLSESMSQSKTELLVSMDASATKVFQVRQTFGLLLGMPDGCWKVFGDTPCPISILGKNSALVLQEALSRLSGSTIHSTNFKVSSRVACMDSHPSNLKAEWSLAASQRRDWSTLINRCEIHHCSRAFKKTFDGLMEGDISAIIHLSLALRTGTAMSVFRSCMKDVIYEQLCILYTPVPDECKVYKQKLMCLCLSTGANLLIKRMLLCKLPNGDWTKAGVVEFHVGHGTRGSISKVRLAQVLSGSLTYILCGCKPAVWPRHRWTGCDLSVEQLLRIEGIHCLLSSTWKKFVLAYGKAAVSGPTANTIELDDGVDDAAAVETVEAVLQEGAGVETNAGYVECVANHTQKNAADNARDRKIATEWMSKSSHTPLATLILLRTSMDPLVKLLNSQLDISSLDWELQQQASVASWFNTLMLILVSCHKDTIK
eukprot:6491101-Amphidinium_carterae.1